MRRLLSSTTVTSAARGRTLAATILGLGLAHCVDLEDEDDSCRAQREAIVQMRSGCICDGDSAGDSGGGYGDDDDDGYGGDGYGSYSDSAAGVSDEDEGCGCNVASPTMNCAEVAAEYARLRSSCDCEEPESDPEPAQPTCELDAPVSLFLSPDDSNSMSSPVQAREWALDGGATHGADKAPFGARPWEFLNYYSFDYPAAEAGAVTLHAELRALAAEGEYYLQIGVGSEPRPDDARAPLNLTLVLDESGSMEGEAMDMLKETCTVIAGRLRAGDLVSLVTWDTENAVLLAAHEVTGPNDAALLQAVGALSPGGGTDLHGGLTAGYELARSAYDRERINRVVLISDGGANVGLTDAELIGQESQDEEQEGIYMVGVGVGEPGQYNDRLMDRVTDLGKGASVFIPHADEAARVFGARFVNTLDVAVRDVQVQLDMPPGFEIDEFSGEEFSENPAEVEPQHLAPNDAMVFLQRVRTCAPELISEDSELSVTVRYKDARTREPHELTRTWSFGELLAQASPQLQKGLAVFTYARLFTGETTIEEATLQLELAEGLLPNDDDLAELREVIEAL